MKILVITTVENTYTRFLREHYNALINRGHVVHVAFNQEASLRNLDNDSADKVLFFDVPYKRGLFNRNVFRIRKSLNKIFENNYDLVSLHTPIASGYTRIFFNRSKYPNTKLIYMTHGYHFHPKSFIPNLIFFLAELILSSKTDIIITINDFDYNVSKRFFLAKKVYKIDGIGLNIPSDRSNKDIRNELNIDRNSFIMTNVAEHNYNKNQVNLIRMLSKIKEINFTLLLVGKGKSTKKLIRMVKKLGIQERVRFLYYRDDVKEILSASDLFVFPSRREGFGMALLEAISLEKRFLAFNIRGVQDICKGYYDNFLVKPYDFREMANRVKSEYSLFLENRPLYKLEVDKTFIQRFSINTVTKEFVRIHESIFDE
jgi:glycosyltransferase involved in cell wall biosynthesis